ncbi:unnamed protein product [Clavelina lepadiformis]|uniref:Medium-chain acyl-CoA ligase ACSF2, mitochondrial n=1 Tax=Clavelina lepadiformis TaxID=159417 RepID=A0ABP0F7Q6_CLALP
MAARSLQKAINVFPSSVDLLFQNQSARAKIAFLNLCVTNLCTSNSRLSAEDGSNHKLKHSYFHAHSPYPLSGLTIGGALEKTTEKFPDRECLVFCETGIRRTFSQFMEEVDQLAAGFIKLGLKKGDRVGIWGPSTLEWVLTQFATGRLGIILVNINPAYQVREVEYALRKVGCKGLVSSLHFKTQNYYEMLCQIAPEIERSPPGQLKSTSLPDLTTIIMMGESQQPGTYRFDDVIKIGGPAEVAEVHDRNSELQFDEAINVQFTSGTTGHPKGATLTHHNIINNAIHIGERLGFDRDHDRILCQVPLYHCFGMVAGVLCMAVHGAANVFPVAGYDPVATVKALEAERCTTIFGTPTMFIDVTTQAELMKPNLPCLTKGVMAGSPCPVEVIVKADEVLGTKIQVSGLMVD